MLGSGEPERLYRIVADGSDKPKRCQKRKSKPSQVGLLKYDESHGTN